MLKNILIISLLSLTQLYAQNTIGIDARKFKATYLLTYQPDSTNINSIDTEEMILFIGNKTSKFLSSNAYLKDSILRSIDKGSINLLNVVTISKNLPKTKFNDKIFKNYPNNKITATEEVLKDYFKYEEPLELFNWNIENKNKTILGYKCQKAITKYAGRNYIAWFTNEIPISDGPYKFNGLPGLILQIHDVKNHYEYKLINLQRVIKKDEIVINNENYIKISKREFFKIKKDFYKNFFKKLEQRGITINFNPSQKKEVLNKFNKRNNPIELNNN